MEKHVDFPVAQEQLGCLVQVPGPHGRTGAAWQMALYILTHGYEGRLGKAGISERGLVYYIESAYHTDGTNDWITLSTGVGPQKHDAMKALLREPDQSVASAWQPARLRRPQTAPGPGQP